MINPNYITHLDNVVRIIITWSEQCGSNARSPAPKAVYIIPYDDLCRFPAISSRLRILFKTLISTVSAYSTAVCSQTCGQKPLSEHPRDRGQKAVFYGLSECCGRMICLSSLSHCTSAGEVKQVLYTSDFLEGRTCSYEQVRPFWSLYGSWRIVQRLSRYRQGIPSKSPAETHTRLTRRNTASYLRHGHPYHRTIRNR